MMWLKNQFYLKLLSTKNILKDLHQELLVKKVPVTLAKEWMIIQMDQAIVEFQIHQRINKLKVF